MTRAPLRLLCGMCWVLVVAIGLGGCGSAPERSAGTARTGADAVAVCTASPNLLLAPTALDPNMVITAQFGGPGPEGFAPPGGPSSVGGLQFIWMEGVNGAVSGLPADFQRLNASSWATQYPDRVLEYVETIQTFADTSNASRFLSMFGGTPHSGPQIVSGGKLVNAPAGSQSSLNLGDESIELVIAPAAAGYPAEVQFVMRRGTTVVTLALLGGSNLQGAPFAPIAAEALAQVETGCSI